MSQEIWKANYLDDVDISDMSDGHLVSIIEMFAKRTNPPPILYELIEVAYTRGIDLDNKYNKENKEKRDAIYSVLLKNGIKSRKYFFPLTVNFDYFKELDSISSVEP